MREAIILERMTRRRWCVTKRHEGPLGMFENPCVAAKKSRIINDCFCGAPTTLNIRILSEVQVCFMRERLVNPVENDQQQRALARLKHITECVKENC
jgi:hypothetical protein